MSESIRPVRARWQACHVCASTDVLVVIEHVGPILCYECVVEGYRYEPGDFAPRHSVTVERYEHGASRSKRYRAECSCGWIGGACDHPATADADGRDHLHEVA